jgi:hypothetical protein
MDIFATVPGRVSQFRPQLVFNVVYESAVAMGQLRAGLFHRSASGGPRCGLQDIRQPQSCVSSIRAPETARFAGSAICITTFHLTSAQFTQIVIEIYILCQLSDSV